MIHLGLIGYPVSHSLSPKIQTAALKACGLEGDYSLFPIHPDDKAGLADWISRIRTREITGLNVTIPHKQNVIEFLDELTPASHAIGAVNVIYFQNDRLIGENTDAPGFLSDLKKFLATEARGCRDLRALILGAGGSARAVVYALIKGGWQVTILSRRIEQAQQLARAFTSSQLTNSQLTNYQLQITTFTGLQPSTFDLIVNTTPVGMSPNTDQSPWPANLPFPPRAAVYDLVYNPRETKLVCDARAQGLQAITGLGMLIEQAALGFALWTGIKAPSEIFRSAVE